MILQRFGRTVSAVRPDFRATAFNEIGFSRGSGFTMEWEEFAERYRRVGEIGLTAESDGRVKLEAEMALLQQLGQRLAAVVAALAPGEVLLLESHPGHDYPRTHERTDSVHEHGDTHLQFHYHLDPPLRFGVFAPSDPGGRNR
jgi:hypothetical protein